MKHLSEALEALDARDTRTRDMAADWLGDLLRGTALSQADAELAVARLVALFVRDVDHGVREAALNSICEAFNRRRLPLRLFGDLVPIEPTLQNELLAHTLCILGSTQDPAAEEAISPFVTHPDARVREEATLALDEIRAGRGPQNAPPIHSS
ncbi:hypothetical protein [Embleya scabrispora]|uniref:hypothetical protein n=1 Tax=Embleya scabrispora TaxID=159449 RepID=UPI00035EFF17|nr:hypothetical protein [Embleya scabrispora]MYS87986.1 hypothetical protein [Streptomyces sp. SID5474]